MTDSLCPTSLGSIPSSSSQSQPEGFLEPFWIEDLDSMIAIRQLELRAEASYLEGHVGGFFHSYVGQEAVQTAALRIFGKEHWWSTSYRCHALAYLLGATAKEIMAELFGKATGNCKGRGGSMHLYTDHLLGGFGIVGGQVPVATGAAFALKYRGEKGRFSICFLGEGAVAQGAFHESLNIAALWSLPILYVIENNAWGMGTAVSKAVSVEPIAASKGSSFGIPGKTIDGSDYRLLLDSFQEVYDYLSAEGKPYLLEVVTHRFKGHSVSDPGLYRTKEELAACVKRDPLLFLKEKLLESGRIDLETVARFERERRQEMIDAIAFARESPWPDVASLEEGVFASQEEGSRCP